MNTFNYYRHIKKSAVKTLVSTGINVREAFAMIRKQMPYLFVSKERCESIDNESKEFDNYISRYNSPFA